VWISQAKRPRHRLLTRADEVRSLTRAVGFSPFFSPHPPQMAPLANPLAGAFFIRASV
jgi:hypothetical protein